MPISVYVKSNGEFLSTTLWVPDKSRGVGLVFCHGWGGGAQYDDLFEPLAERAILLFGSISGVTGTLQARAI